MNEFGLTTDLRDRVELIHAADLTGGAPPADVNLIEVFADGSAHRRPKFLSLRNGWLRIQAPAKGDGGEQNRYMLWFHVPAERVVGYRRYALQFRAKISATPDDWPEDDLSPFGVRNLISHVALLIVRDDLQWSQRALGRFSEHISSKQHLFEVPIRLPGVNVHHPQADYTIGLSITPSDQTLRLRDLSLFGFADDFCAEQLSRNYRTEDGPDPRRDALKITDFSQILPIDISHDRLEQVDSLSDLAAATADSIAILGRWEDFQDQLPTPEMTLGPPDPDSLAELTIKISPRPLSGPSRYMVKLNHGVVFPGGLIIDNAGRVVADSFRRLPRPHDHRYGTPSPENDIQIQHSYRRLRFIEGPAVYLSTEHDAHFGHLILETLSKCWFEGYGPVAELKVLVNGFVDEMHIRLLELAGLSRDKIHLLDEPATVEQLYVPSQLFILDREADPAVNGIWQRVVENHVAGATDFGERVYISRSQWTAKRNMLNEHEVENILRGFGFSVVNLEKLSMDDKVDCFSKAKTICGPLGSGLHCTMFSPAGSSVIALCPRHLVQNNLTLIGRVRNQRLHYLIGKSVTREGEKANSYYSDWNMDLELLKDFCTQLLD